MLTVALATHNGSGTLQRVLPAYAAATPPPGGWQLVIVDNASEDDTAAIVRRAAERMPIVFLQEPRPGKNRALNAALPHFAGELIVLTDDDAIPAPDFLVKWSEVPGRHVGFAMFGGTVRPAWPETPPSWLVGSTVQLSAAFAITDTDQPEGPVTPERIFGPNMAVRGEVFTHGFRFDESIGPNGRSYAMGSETALTMRLAQSGHRGWFLPGIVVEHIIRPRQFSRSWLQQRATNFGRGLYRQERLRYGAGSHPLWFGVPRWRIRRQAEHLGASHARLVAAMLSGDPARITGADWHARVVRAWFAELVRAAK